jgi:hypothetical protein
VSCKIICNPMDTADRRHRKIFNKQIKSTNISDKTFKNVLNEVMKK